MVQIFMYRKLFEILQEASVCRRCILRFFGAKEYTSYITRSTVEETIQRLLTSNDKTECESELNVEDSTILDQSNSPLSKRFMPSPCPACLGILQDACEDMISKVDEAVTRNKHIVKDFVLHVSLPAVVELRDKLFFCHLKDLIGDSFSLEETDIPSVKDICKWVIGSQYGKLTCTEFTPDSDFQIILSSIYPETVKECLVLFKKVPGAFQNAKKRKATVEDIYSKSSIMKAITELSSEIKTLYDLPPSPPIRPCSFNEVQCNHSPLYLGGRYNKYSRELSQTPWVLNGERKMLSSVSELITDVVQKYVMCDKIVFSASGREDVDVRMLGNGRPFVLEVFNPRRLEWSVKEMKNIEQEINSGTEAIAVHELQVISKMDISLLKEGEELKRKTYSAHCIVEKILSEDDVKLLESLKDVKLDQKTPIRVLHRRTLSTREKIIHNVQAKILSDHRLELKVETQAGTYVKEFVHSDFGRTVPNLGTLLGTKADILELDVECIHLDWPPKSS